MDENALSAAEVEAKIPVPEVAEAEKVDAPKRTEIEDLAISMGWNPDFEGAEGKEALSAKDYIKKGRDIQKDMRERIKSQGKALDDMKASINGIQDHYEKVSKAEIAKAKKELSEKRKEAIIDGDIDAVEKLDEEIDTLKEQEKTNKKESKDGDKIFTAWQKDNTWFGTDLDMSDYAQYKLNAALRKNPNMSVSEQLDHAREAVEKKFPDYFGKKTEKKPPTTAVNEAGSRPGANGKKTFTEADLSATQRSAMNTFVRAKIMTKDQYISDLVKIGELK